MNAQDEALHDIECELAICWKERERYLEAEPVSPSALMRRDATVKRIDREIGRLERLRKQVMLA